MAPCDEECLLVLPDVDAKDHEMIASPDVQVAPQALGRHAVERGGHPDEVMFRIGREDELEVAEQVDLNLVG